MSLAIQIESISMDPYCKMNYSSFYIKGIKDIFGPIATFSFDEFKNDFVSTQCFLFIVKSGKQRIKFAIDFHDDRKCELESLRWCDHYAKINLHHTTFQHLEESAPGDYEKIREKVFNIPPSFGIRFLNIPQTLSFCMKLIMFRRRSAIEQVKDVLRAYIKRLPLEDYQNGNVKDNYVFFIASIWHKTTAYINYPRANFIRACLKYKVVNFEGGFIDIGYDSSYMEDVKSLMYKDKKIPLKQFIDKTRKSAIVFNNPSVAYCHGWKLAEYLSMGKAILSTPLSNQLPVDLDHKKNIFIVEDNYEAISKGLSYLLENPEERKKLEREALIYWNQYVKPEAVINQILKNSSILNKYCTE